MLQLGARRRPHERRAPPDRQPILRPPRHAGQLAQRPEQPLADRRVAAGEQRNRLEASRQQLLDGVRRRDDADAALVVEPKSGGQVRWASAMSP
jgi:hypothetical protein